jgi:eukaryotic-like serine/threonine-protein kinase
VARATQQYLGNYRLLNMIRAGKSCQVWEAMRDSTGQRVALKVLSEDHWGDRQEVAFMRHEYAVGKQLSHRYVIQMFDISVNSSECYVAMELCKAPNLKQLVHQGIDKLFPRLKQAMLQAVDGLAYFHSRGWVHRDIKPDNFLLPAGGDLKLIDFALAQRSVEGFWKMLSGGKASRIQGTRSYMSPEQIRGQPLDQRADIYSFGCMFHELLGGKPPFTGVTTNDLLMKHLRNAIPAVQAANRNVTDECAALIKRMLAKKPESRPKSMTQVLGELERMEVFKEPPPEVA